MLYVEWGHQDMLLICRRRTNERLWVQGDGDSGSVTGCVWRHGEGELINYLPIVADFIKRTHTRPTDWWGTGAVPNTCS